jgi:hypothetical protein
MDTKRCHVRFYTSLIPAIMLTLGFSACAQKHSHMPPGDYMSQQNSGGEIRQLEAARELDQSEAARASHGTVAREDYLEQAGKANMAIEELTHGYPVSEEELRDALQVPPENLSGAEKSELIQRIEEARQATDHNEQSMLNGVGWGYSDQAPATFAFDQRKQLDDEVIKDLKIGQQVHWDDIQKATQVVQNPD